MEQLNHECLQDERIRLLTSRVDRLETKVENIELTLNKLLWGMFGTLATSVVTLLTILVQSRGGQ